MKARLPTQQKLTKKQVTGAQLESIINAKVAEKLNEYTQQALVIYQLTELIALHEYAGWSNKKLNDFLTNVSEVNAWYEKLLSSADNFGGREGENLDLAVTLLAQKAEDYGIQWQELLGADIVAKCDPFKGANKMQKG